MAASHPDLEHLREVSSRTNPDLLRARLYGQEPPSGVVERLTLLNRDGRPTPPPMTDDGLDEMKLHFPPPAPYVPQPSPSSAHPSSAQPSSAHPGTASHGFDAEPPPAQPVFVVVFLLVLALSILLG